MLKEHARIANWRWEEAGAHTTRSVSPHGLNRGQRRHKRMVNRGAKRKAERLAFGRELVA